MAIFAYNDARQFIRSVISQSVKIEINTNGQHLPKARTCFFTLCISLDRYLEAEGGFDVEFLVDDFNWVVVEWKGSSETTFTMA